MKNAGSVLSDNIRIFSQLTELAETLRSKGIRTVLLKGAALIALFPEYSRTREMIDIDILVKRKDVETLRQTLLEEGYGPCPGEPCSFFSSSRIAHIDITDNLWYLSARENEELFEQSLGHPVEGLPGMHHLPPLQMYAHLIAHACIHHSMEEEKWKDDLRLLENKWKEHLARGEVREILRKYGIHSAYEIYSGTEEGCGIFGKVVRRAAFSSKGHLMRFWFLPFRKKTAYLLSSLFPTDEFLISRYNIKNRSALIFFRMLRPLLVSVKIASAPVKLLFSN
ncbi:MAG: nucleotidyltransferase family protein [Endomicrobiales bacterium]|nr:nucleotidyltransferase family protein [Endomicrobiales bacterium]